MQRTRIKICGVRDPETATVAVQAGASLIGLVFVPGSPRRVSIQQAKRVAEALPPFVDPVGVFVNESPARILEIAHAVGLRMIQMHGHETIEHVGAVWPLRVIKAIPFKPSQASEQIGYWRRWSGRLEGVLWDAPPAEKSVDPSRQGGNGKSVDWSDLARCQHKGGMIGLLPMMLAGGLSAENVSRSIRMLRPYAVDVSSGVEMGRGVKCRELIAKFCNAVRRADASCDGA
jgi:phosphoribosylanthranilate isomerase